MPDDYERALKRLDAKGGTEWGEELARTRLLRAFLRERKALRQYLPEESTIKQATDKVVKEFADGR